MQTNSNDAMVCGFCGLDVIVVCEVGLCTHCCARLEADAAAFEAASVLRIE